MGCSIRVFCFKCWIKCIDIFKCVCIGFIFELFCNSKVSFFIKEIFIIVNI